MRKIIVFFLILAFIGSTAEARSLGGATSQIRQNHGYFFRGYMYPPVVKAMTLGTTWYVRDGGGTATQCTGKADAVYPGTGTNQPCAFARPMTALGYCTGNESGHSGSPPCQVSGFVTGGDTLQIDGDSDINPGQQAQFEVGYDDVTSGALTPGCNSAFTYACQLGPLPAGPDAAHPTTMVGVGTHRPQIWGTQRAGWVVYADTNFWKIQNIEITDHLDCAYNDSTNGCNYNSPPYGKWAEDGLFIGGSGTLQDVWIHGIGRYGINTDNLGDVIFTRVWAIGNGYGGITIGNNGSTSVTGTLTFNQPIVEWSGCSEIYPMTNAGIDNPLNYHNCFGQGNGGYGDGLAFGATGNQNAGNWIITGPGSISWNVQDGLDELHGNGNGIVQIDKMKFEGNGGNQVKMNAITGVMTNSLVVDDCGWWYQSAQAAPGAMGPGDSCRAQGNSISYYESAGTGNTYTFYNNTIIGMGNIQILQNGTCDASNVLTVKNNVFHSGYDWIDDTSFNGAGGNSQTHFIYRAGTDGDGTGCSGAFTLNEDYNLIFGGATDDFYCGGAHDKCAVNPQFTGGTFLVGTSGGGRSTYYTGFAGTTLIGILNTSPAKGAGVTGLSYWNNSNDYLNVVRPSPPSMGGLEVASCAVSAYGCFYNSDCCSSSCTNNVCAGAPTCSPDVATCSTGGQCCNSNCCAGVCGSTSCQANPSTNLNDIKLNGALM